MVEQDKERLASTIRRLGILLVILYYVWGIYLLFFKGIAFLVWLFISVVISEAIGDNTLTKKAIVRDVT